MQFDPSQVMVRDVHPLRHAAGKARWTAKDDERFERSRAEVLRRRNRAPAVTFPADLPITRHVEEIVDLLRSHQVVVVAGETGSGKTTQLPKACLAAGFGARGMIGHTQPRRLAARTVAKRIADELAVTLGEQVGFAVRFSEQYGPDTLVKVMTDGLLLNEIRSDRYLNAYEVLIIDEAHERSLNVDFLIGYAKSLLKRRRDLKLVITSATIDVEAFSRHFDGAPVVSVGGRGYPVEVRYAAAADDSDERLIDCLTEIAGERRAGPRDVLLFQSGEREILETSRLVRHALGDRFEVLPLYARLPVREQQRIFEPSQRPRIVLATNVAETSITVPNIGYVVDPGVARISRYSYRSKLQRLPIEAISQASADQRMGRCGRIAPGVCYRLYEEADYASRPRYTDPELKRTNLAAVVLQMRAFRLGDIASFPFIDPPDPRVVRDAVRMLHELGALEQDRLTRTGRTMARLPVDPRLARMLIEAAQRGALTELLIIVAALAIQDPRDRPLDKQQAADAAHREFIDPDSDFLSFVNLWQWCENTRIQATRSGFRKALQQRFLSPTRVREWRELHRQLLLTCRSLGLRSNQNPAPYADVHRSILAGSLSFIGLKDVKGNYQGARGLGFRIFPGSGLAQKQPKWMVAAEIAETQRTYARCVAKIEARWIEEAAGHVLKRSHSEPHWNEKRGEVQAYERVVVYGLPVVERRPVAFAPIDPDAAREIFVREGLVKRSPAIKAAFLDHNAALVREVLELQAKGRRTDLLVGDEAQAAFYLERLPQEVASRATLQRWLQRAEPAAVDALNMTEADLLARLDFEVRDQDFPATLSVEGLELPLKYRFAPGRADDGVSVMVEVGVLSRLRQEPLDWLVPGFFEQKCVELVKSLPKGVRKRLAPVPDRVAEVIPLLLREDRYRSGRLLVALAERIEAEFGVRVAADDWHLDRVSPFLAINVQVCDRRGRIIDQDREVEALQRRLFERVERSMADGIKERFEREDLRGFPEQGVPESVVCDEGTGQTVAYPVLEDRGDHVDLRLRSYARGQADINRRGYSRLVLLGDPKTTRYLKKQFEKEQAMPLHFATLGTKADLVDALLRASVWHCFFEGEPLPTTERDFRHRVESRRERWVGTFLEAADSARTILAERFRVARSIDALTSPAFEQVRADLEAQLARLVPADFPNEIPPAWLSDVPRYLAGMAHRAENLQGRVQRDAEGIAEIRAWEARLAALAEASDDRTALHELRFALEEYRIALFSQSIGTKGKVSKERLRRLFEPLERRSGLR